MQSEQHIRRLVRELDLPEQADQVIQRPKYWTEAFCWLYFERCDDLIFDDATAGLQAAEIAPELVEMVSRYQRDQTSLAALHLRALAVLGSAYRASGQLDRAEEVYMEAFRQAESGVSDIDHANLLFRVSTLRSFQNRPAEALQLADEAVAIYRDAAETVQQQHLGESLTIRGTIHSNLGRDGLAVKDWSEALTCTDPKRRPRVHYAAAHNLAVSLVETTVDSHSLSRVESYLRQARRFLAKRPRSVQKLRVIWLQGLIMIRFGSTRRGEAALMAARKGFIEMQAPFDMALVSLGLGRYLQQSRQLVELRAMVVETQRLFRDQCSDPSANEALALWAESVLSQTLTVEAMAETWAVLKQRSLAPAFLQAQSLPS